MAIYLPKTVHQINLLKTGKVPNHYHGVTIPKLQQNRHCPLGIISITCYNKIYSIIGADRELLALIFQSTVNRLKAFRTILIQRMFSRSVFLNLNIGNKNIRKCCHKNFEDKQHT